MTRTPPKGRFCGQESFSFAFAKKAEASSTRQQAADFTPKSVFSPNSSQTGEILTIWRFFACPCEQNPRLSNS
jgi:hypothetical protein